MARFCGRRTAKRLAECVILHERLVRRLNDAEMPFIHRNYPPPWEAPEPDAGEWLPRINGRCVR